MKHNIDCSLICEENLMFHSNMDSIKHILINIFSNAIDAIDGNGLIEVTCSLGEAGLTIRIEDTGEGIEEDQIEQIFNPFYTTKQPDKGTGLGLYIVYNEVKKLGGEVNVYRSKANHTVFEIQLPDGKEMI
jgi:polar amino acid transport system substrate-binding protein